MPRDPYITTQGLDGMRGMLLHLGSDEENFIARNGPPPREPNINTFPYVHKLQSEADILGGMEGEILESLLDYARRQIGKDPAITKCYRDLIMIAKLSCPPEQLLAAQAEAEQRLQKIEEAKDVYQKRHKQYESSISRSRQNYNAIHGVLRTRWEKILKSLRAIVARDPHLDSMALGDAAIFRYLSTEGLVTIQNDQVTNFSYELTVPCNETMSKIVETMWEIVERAEQTGAQRTRLEILDLRKPKTTVGN